MTVYQLSRGELKGLAHYSALCGFAVTATIIFVLQDGIFASSLMIIGACIILYDSFKRWQTLVRDNLIGEDDTDGHNVTSPTE